MTLATGADAHELVRVRFSINGGARLFSLP
jgi:hypothetical protein